MADGHLGYICYALTKLAQIVLVEIMASVDTQSQLLGYFAGLDECREDRFVIAILVCVGTRVELDAVSVPE